MAAGDPRHRIASAGRFSWLPVILLGAGCASVDGIGGDSGGGTISPFGTYPSLSDAGITTDAMARYAEGLVEPHVESAESVLAERPVEAGIPGAMARLAANLAEPAASAVPEILPDDPWRFDPDHPRSEPPVDWVALAAGHLPGDTTGGRNTGAGPLPAAARPDGLVDWDVLIAEQTPVPAEPPTRMAEPVAEARTDPQVRPVGPWSPKPTARAPVAPAPIASIPMVFEDSGVMTPEMRVRLAEILAEQEAELPELEPVAAEPIDDGRQEPADRPSGGSFTFYP